MKKIFIFLVLLVCLLGTVQAAMTYGPANYLDNLSYAGSGNKVLDPIYRFMDETAADFNILGVPDPNKMVFYNGGYVSNVDNNEIKIGENAEAFSWDFDANTVTIRNKTDITAYDLRAFPTMYLATIDACDIIFDGIVIATTPAELNKNAGVTAGTARANKVAVLGSANDLDYAEVTKLLLRTRSIYDGNNTYTLPDYNGCVPLVIRQSATVTRVTGAAVADCNRIKDANLVVADDWFTAGKVLKWTLFGNQSGGNKSTNVTSITLFIADANFCTLTPDVNYTGDWQAMFTVYEHTDTANQLVMGELVCGGGSKRIIQQAADTTNITSAAFEIAPKIHMVDGNDLVDCNYVKIETWTK